MKLEKEFKKVVKNEICNRFPGCVIISLNPENKQGIPDMLILYNRRWGMLEFKRSKESSKRPNQEYWVNYYNDLSFASFIYPENKEEVLNALYKSLSDEKKTRKCSCFHGSK